MDSLPIIDLLTLKPSSSRLGTYQGRNYFYLGPPNSASKSGILNMCDPTWKLWMSWWSEIRGRHNSTKQVSLNLGDGTCPGEANTNTLNYIHPLPPKPPPPSPVYSWWSLHTHEEERELKSGGGYALISYCCQSYAGKPWSEISSSTVCSKRTFLGNAVMLSDFTHHCSRVPDHLPFCRLMGSGHV